MKALTALVWVLPFYFIWNFAWTKPAPTYSGSSYREVWDLVKSDPYQVFPQYESNSSTLIAYGVNYMERAARRTLIDESDYREWKAVKVIRPNGICLAGHWKITEENPYSGFFRPGSEGLLIARASVGFSETQKGSLRGFGMAGKLFPTLDPNSQVKTSNFFLIDNNSGTSRDARFLDAVLVNEPPVNLLNVARKVFRDSAKKKAFDFDFVKTLKIVNDEQEKAEGKGRDGKYHAGIRQLYPISRAGEGEAPNLVTPIHMKVTAHPGTSLLDDLDFRDELLHSSSPCFGMQGGSSLTSCLVFDLFVSDESVDRDEAWKKIGYLEFTERVVSVSCDQSLYFHHPKWVD